MSQTDASYQFSIQGRPDSNYTLAKINTEKIGVELWEQSDLLPVLCTLFRFTRLELEI